MKKYSQLNSDSERWETDSKGQTNVTETINIKWRNLWPQLIEHGIVDVT